MNLYKIEWKQSAKKELKKLDKQVIPKILQAVENLADNPYPSNLLTDKNYLNKI